MRIDETPRDYRNEREASWEEMQKTQAIKDQIDLDKTRKEFVNNDST